MPSSSCFNSRSREGSDIIRAHHAADWFVSIHAPVKGATQQEHRRQGAKWCFNSRSREGSDTIDEDLSPELISFNSRSREGSDQEWLNSLKGDEGFQFTLP